MAKDIYPIPSFEDARLRDLWSLSVLDSNDHDEHFDRYTTFASLNFNAPIALISLVDKDRQWFKSKYGLDASETPRCGSFCAYAIMEDKILVIPDATLDERFQDHPLVTGAPHIRFYAGAVLHGQKGYPIGTVCIIDTKARDFNHKEQEKLIAFAKLVEQKIIQLNKFKESHDALKQEIDKSTNYNVELGIPNRVLFEKLLKRNLLFLKRESAQAIIGIIGLTRAHDLNRIHGPKTDQVILKESVERLEDLRLTDKLALYDENHLVFYKNNPDSLSEEEYANNITSCLDQPFTFNHRDYRIPFSVGLSIYPLHGDNASALMSNAYHAKNVPFITTKSEYCIHSTTLIMNTNRKYEIEQKLLKPLENIGIELYYQPKIDLDSGKLVGAEALCRWNDAELGFVSPDEFISIAERSDLILKIDEWVVKTACTQVSSWLRQGLDPVQIGVNITGASITEAGFVEMLENHLTKSGIDGSLLDIELTERTVMNDINKVIQNIKEARRLGITFSIDDYGTGYSSLQYLQQLPINTIKIDRSFINELTSDQSNQTITKSIINLGHGLGLSVVAEGVETLEQLKYLIDFKSDLAQGYLFSKPLDTEQFEKLLSGSRNLLDPTLETEIYTLEDLKEGYS